MLQLISEMFDEIEGYKSRKDQKLKSCDPTDSQAEILAFGVVLPEKIRGIVFRDKAMKQAYSQKYPDLKMYHHPEGKGMFASRTYVREYF